MDNKYSNFNKTKKEAEKKVKIGLPFVVIGVLLIWFMQGGSTLGVVFGFISLLGGGFVAAAGATAFNKLKKNFKQTVLKEMFKETIPGVNYSPEYGLDERTVYATDFLKRADRFHSEDFLEGQIDGVDFISSDVKLEERHVQHTKHGTRTYYVTYFLGRVFRFEFNKEFAGRLQVLEAGSPKSRGYNKVKLESVDFNKKFKTYSTEDITAFYILTPDIMEAIHKLEQRNPGRIGLSFVGDYLFVAINNNKDTFELKMFKEIDNSMVEEFKKDILVIKDFIMTLKLNNNLFKK